MSSVKTLPVGWKKIKLKKLVTQDIKNGYSPNCPEEPNGTWILGLGNLTENGFDSSHAKPAPKDDKRVKDFLLTSGDFLISRSNTLDKVGRTMLFRGEIENCSYPDLLMRFRVDENQVLNEYLESYLRSSIVRKYIQSCASGTSGSMVKINKSVVESIIVILPPFSEQKAIADLLSTWDEAIEKTERLIQALEKRLDAYGREVFDSNCSGKVSGWLSVRLKDVLWEHGDKSTGNEEVYSVSVHKGLVNQIEHLGRSFSAANTDNYNCVHYGDIVYTKSPTGDFPLGIVKQSYHTKNVIVSPLYGVFSPKSFYLGAVINFYFSSPKRTRNYLFPIVQKGAKNTIAITNKTFLSSKLHLPIDEAAQKMIAEYVSAARDEIDMLKQLREKYKSQKRGLMQKMLTGAWRMKTEIINQYMEV